MLFSGKIKGWRTTGKGPARAVCPSVCSTFSQHWWVSSLGFNSSSRNSGLPFFCHIPDVLVMLSTFSLLLLLSISPLLWDIGIFAHFKKLDCLIGCQCLICILEQVLCQIPASWGFSMTCLFSYFNGVFDKQFSIHRSSNHWLFSLIVNFFFSEKSQSLKLFSLAFFLLLYLDPSSTL